jgi:spore coat polysaccharide biosynthesis protein SpsF
MKTAVIIQARMTSSRLPGKILADLAGRPMLEQQVRRLRAMREADVIAIATTVLPSDDPVEALARRLGLPCIRGDELDVLSRYVSATAQLEADLVVRVTGDCPLIDAGEVDRVVAALRDDPEGADYASNVQERSFPRGLDAEALWADVLRRVDRLGRTQPAREHVTWFLHRERPDLFVRRSVIGPRNDSDLRWTVDTESDLAMVRRLYDELGLADASVGWGTICAHVRANPSIAAMNAEIVQKER